jgi:hypothetical protein
MMENRPLQIVQPDPATRLNVIGVPGQGKSIFREWFQIKIYRYVLWNPLGDFNIGEAMTVDDLRERVDEFRKGRLQITIEPISYDEMEMAEEYDEVCARVEEIGAVHFATEEIGLVAKPSRVPPYLNRLSIRGRHRAISLSTYGQRFHQFPLITRGTASEIVAYRQTDPDDVNDFERRISPAVAPVPLNHLPDFHFIYWTPEGGANFCSPIPLTSDMQAKVTEYQRVEPSASHSPMPFQGNTDF